MAYTKEQQDAINTASASIINRLGLPKLKTDWSYEQRFNYNKELAAVINSNPAFFPEETRQLAKDIAQRDFQPLDEYSIGDAIRDFSAEFVNQAQEINPLSTVNRGKTANTLIGVVLIGAVVFFGYLAVKYDPRRNQ